MTAEQAIDLWENIVEEGEMKSIQGLIDENAHLGEKIAKRASEQLIRDWIKHACHVLECFRRFRQRSVDVEGYRDVVRTMLKRFRRCMSPEARKHFVAKGKPNV